MASSVKFNVPGAVNLKVSCLSGLSCLKSLGFTNDGVEVEEREFVIECKTDRYGGEQGPAADVQTLGREAIIRLNLTEFNAEYFHMLEMRMPGHALAASAPGQIIPPGTLKFGAGGLVRCMLYGALDLAAVTAGTAAAELLTPRNYPFCEVVDASSRNLGTRYARASLTLKARQGLVSSEVVLWNRTST
jgi:hypothetical protein